MHLDEHTLELFVLGEDFPQAQKARIGKHLISCQHCRRRAEELREFYQTVDRELVALRAAESGEKSMAMVPQTRRKTPVAFQERYGAVEHRTTGIVKWFTAYSRLHPLRSAMGGIAVIGLLAVSSSFLLQQNAREKNPAYVHLNPAAERMEIYNSSDDMIWWKPCRNVEVGLMKERENGYGLVSVGDIDGDAKSEVVTTLVLASTERSQYYDWVSVLNSDGSLRHQKRMGEPFAYVRSPYDTAFDASGLLITPDAGGNEKEIFVCVKNRRSPFSLIRLDTELNILGRYWHFGHLEGPALVTFNAEGSKKLILWGTNDAAEAQGLPRSVVVVLDPTKLTGTTESSATPGFGYQQASAEQWYLRFPDPDIAVPLSAISTLYRLGSITEDAIRVVQHFQGAPGVEFGLEYVLGKDMVVKQAKAISGYEIFHGNLVRSGEIRSVLDDSYFDALRRGVRYWDGERWVPNVVMVKRRGV